MLPPKTRHRKRNLQIGPGSGINLRGDGLGDSKSQRGFVFS